MAASYYGHEKTVQVLLEHGANPNAQCHKGSTPLTYACAGAHLSIVRMLLQYGADPAIQSHDGLTPREIALGAQGHGHLQSELVSVLRATQLLRALPNEILNRVFAFLDIPALGAVAAVNRHWHQLANDSLLWRARCAQRGWVSSELELLYLTYGLNVWKVTYGQNCLLQNNWLHGRHRHAVVGLHTSEIFALSALGPRVATAQKDGVRIWDTDTNTLVAFFPTASPALSVAISDTHVYSGHADGSISLLTLADQTQQQVTTAHGMSVSCLSVDSRGLVSASFDSCFKTWSPRLETADSLLRIPAHQGDIFSLKIKNGTVITGSFDMVCKVWDRDTGANLAEFKGHTVSPFVLIACCLLLVC